MLNIIVPYSSRVLLIEIWSDWTQTHSNKDRYIKTEAKRSGEKQMGECVRDFLKFLFTFYNKNLHLDSMEESSSILDINEHAQGQGGGFGSALLV